MKLTYKPKEPARVAMSVRVEPRVKAWLVKQFPESVSHGVNHILAEYMAKHTKGGANAND
jgi:hypothetical protein